MQILVLSNVAGQFDRLRAVLDRGKEAGADAIFVLGNLVAPATADTQERYSLALQILGDLDVPVYLVPGAQDQSLATLSQAIQRYRGTARMHLVHRHAAPFGDDVVAGFGGHLVTTQPTDPHLLQFPAWEAHTAFEHLARYNTHFERARRRILLFAMPPVATTIDRDADEIHHGSPDVARIIRAYQPHLVCCAGPDHGRGSERIAGALVVNPGSLADGSYALVDLETMQVKLERLIDVLPTDTGLVRTIVVGFDGSAEAWQALEMAAGMGRTFGAQVTLVHAFDPIHPALGEPYLEETVAERTARAERLLNEAAQFIADLEPERTVLEGPAPQAILRVAETRKADLIIMGAHGYGAVRSLLGSVSAHVLRHAPCPVLLARQGPRTPALQEKAREA